MHVSYFRIASLMLLWMAPAVWAGPSPGTYDLYDGSGRKMGRIFSAMVPSTHAGKSSTRIEISTKLEPEAVSKYRFHEKDVAHIQDGKLVSFRRETDDNGKKSTVTGERRPDGLFLYMEKEGQKVTTVVPLSSFDLTEFEMDLPDSKFTSLKKKGETTALRVFMVELLKPVLVSRNIVDAMKAPFQGEEVPVIVAVTLVNGKASTAWYHAKTRKLLQEEGANHLMSRVSE